jgi:hypothetical protein
MTFELLLNPSVEAGDEQRLSAQARRILTLFRTRHGLGLEVSTIDLQHIGLQYNARLYEVRRFLIRRGECIDLIRNGEGGVNYYKIVPLEKSEFYKNNKDKLCDLAPMGSEA